MPAPKGHKRYGGRTAGTPNKSSVPVNEACERLGLSPVEVLLEYLAPVSEKLNSQDAAVRHGYRFQAAKELMQYLYPKKKALEVSADVDMNLINRIKEFEALPNDELEKIKNKKE